MKKPPSLSVKLFYSYSHIDRQFKKAMEDTLANLRRDAILHEWSDAQITPGQSLSQRIKEELSTADIVVFLLSPAFLASDACIAEWERVGQLSATGQVVFRVPVIVRPCAWKDFLGDNDVKVLPDDGLPISATTIEDQAWLEVYEGIKEVIATLRATFSPKQGFLDDLSSTDFPSEPPITLPDLFVFPSITRTTYSPSVQPFRQPPIANVADLLAVPRALIHGEDKSGKSALARSLHLSLLDDNKPTIFIDLATVSRAFNDSLIRHIYQEQFHVDYGLWTKQPSKTLILDNVTDDPRLVDFLLGVESDFDRIYVVLSSDIFRAFFKDDTRLADFQELTIEPLTRNQQESLIRKRLSVSNTTPSVTDGFVDQVEGHVNSIIISNKIVPRYPFFVLSILQTYETFMPRTIAITSYGHCYYVLIIASLIRAGISEADDAVNSCFNFAEHLAFATYNHRKEHPNRPFDFETFTDGYRARFFVMESIINRLKHLHYGIISEDGTFRKDYMYYFFLGKFLAGNKVSAEDIVAELCQNSYVEENYLTLLFTIHHATDEAIIEEILLGTMCTLDSVPVATLDEEETSRFASLITAFPERVLSSRPVEEERARERNGRSMEDEPEEPEDALDRTEDDSEDVGVGMYRIFRNNKIMGQVLRTRHGNLEKERIEEIIQTIADSSLRLVNLILEDDDEINRLALYIKAKVPKAELEDVKKILQSLSFLWTMSNIEQAVEAVNVPDIRSAVKAVVSRGKTPAYDILGYFSELDGAQELTEKERNSLAALQEKHSDEFIKRVLSIRTQFYMNTHFSKTPIEQSVCSVLGIKYQPRLLSPR